MTTKTRSKFGDELKRWRQLRRVSQLDLSARSGVSQRHLSFLETGRSAPSREMVIHLSVVLDVPLRDRNRWLGAAGFAPAYGERGLDEPAMDQIRHVLELILAAHQPFPAYVVDRAWNIVLANPAAAALTARLIDPATAPVFGGNLLRLSLHPDGLRRSLLNWKAAAAALLSRLEREVEERPMDDELADLLEEVLCYPGIADLPGRPPVPDADDLLIPLHIRRDGLDLRLFTTIATIGAPYDITVEELRLETLFPADSESEATLRLLSD